MKRNFIFLFILTISAYSIDALYSKLTINLTESLPYRLYWIGDAPFKKGGFVMFDSPLANIQKPFVKSVGCIAGETLENRHGSFYCNGTWIGSAFSDVGEREIEQFDFNGMIPNGYFFALGTHPQSYDSKYFGLIKVTSVQPVTPIL